MNESDHIFPFCYLILCLFLNLVFFFLLREIAWIASVYFRRVLVCNTEKKENWATSFLEFELNLFQSKTQFEWLRIHWMRVFISSCVNEIVTRLTRSWKEKIERALIIICCSKHGIYKYIVSTLYKYCFIW